MKQTVIAVVHGSDAGNGVDVEVYPYDPNIVGGHKAGQMVASWRPQPGELDDAGRVNARLHALQTVPGYSLAPGSRAASGFLTNASARNIAFVRAMSGGAGGPVYDETYEYQVGEILLFDAEVDHDSLTVDWDSAVPHPSTDPTTVSSEWPVQRLDGAIVDPHAYRTGLHRVHPSPDGTRWPVNHAGQRVIGLSEQQQEQYAAADRAEVRLRGPLLVTVDYGNGDGDGARLRAEVAETALQRGTVDPLGPDDGAAFRAVDLEALRLAAGEQHASITDENGRPVGAVYLVDADHSAPRVDGTVIFDGLGASNAGERDPSIGELSVSRAAGALRVRTSGSRFSNSVSGEQKSDSAFAGGGAPAVGSVEPSARAAAEPHRDTPQPRAGLGAGIESMLGLREGRQALVAVSSRTASLVREHGPTLVTATKAKLKDPAVQTALKVAMLTAVEAGLASKDGGAAKFAKAADTAIRAGGIAVSAQGSRPSRDDRYPGLAT